MRGAEFGVRAGGLNGVLCGVRPRDRVELRGWLRAVLGVDVPDGAVCEGHDSPMDYLEHVFFERGGDVVVWANRGGGKTFYGAVATLLDLLFKPDIAVRLLGGSFEQSSKMFEYLRWMLERPGLRERIDGRLTQTGVRLVNGSVVELLSQSETSVRGQRVQKLRCDELELFDRDVWSAAQFVTRSARCGGFDVTGSIEVFSTMHKPFGLMSEVIDAGEVWRAFRWCALDVIERCDESRHACEGCGLWSACGGVAREANGFLSVDDVLSQQRRSDAESFEAEMLCRRPTRCDAVFKAFDTTRHVRAVEADRSLAWVGGMDFGVRSPTVVLWAQLRPADDETVVEVVDEYACRDGTMDGHLAAMRRRGWPGFKWIGVDPAGNQRNDQTGVSNITLLRRAGYTVRHGRTHLAAGLSELRRRLGSAEREPMIVIHPRCRQLIESMAKYHFDADRPWSQTPVKDGADHAVDALRYMVTNLGQGGRVTSRGY